MTTTAFQQKLKGCFLCSAQSMLDEVLACVDEIVEDAQQVDDEGEPEGCRIA